MYKRQAITYNWHDPETSLVEAVLSRGDRRLSAVLENVWQNGGKFDAWSEYFSLSRWLDALNACGLDAAFYANRERSEHEVLPWSRISVGVNPRYLWREREQCYRGAITPDCRKQCMGCGANQMIGGGACDG